LQLARTESGLPLELENHWFQEKRIILKFAGYDSIDQAKQLIGFEVTVPEDDCVELEEDEFLTGNLRAVWSKRWTARKSAVFRK